METDWQSFFTNPFLQTDDDTVIVLNPSIIVPFLIHRIVTLADEYGSKDILINAYNNNIWKKCKQDILKLGHKKVDEKAYGKLRRAQKNVLDAIVSTGISPALREKLDEIESEIKLREQQINDAEHTAESFIPVNPAAVKSCIKDMKNVLKKADFESIKRLIFDFVERVTVYLDHVEVIFKLPVPLNPELVKPALCRTVSKTTDHIMINHYA